MCLQFHNTDDLSKAVPVSTIMARAKELKEEGPPRAQRLDCVWPEEQTSTKSEKEKEKGAGEEDLVSAGKTWRSNPLHMWVEDAIVELIENHCKTVRSVCVYVCVWGLVMLASKTRHTSPLHMWMEDVIVEHVH